jgi:hypothetical protein
MRDIALPLGNESPDDIGKIVTTGQEKITLKLVRCGRSGQTRGHCILDADHVPTFGMTVLPDVHDHPESSAPPDGTVF